MSDCGVVSRHRTRGARDDCFRTKRTETCLSENVPTPAKKWPSANASAVIRCAHRNCLRGSLELGIDHGCRKFGGGQLTGKAILILEATRYDYQKGLSDIAGWDIHPHGGDYIEAVRSVRDWLVRQAGAAAVGASRILGNYAAFQEWYWERELGLGPSEDDIKAYPTLQMVEAMRGWVDAGRPV